MTNTSQAQEISKYLFRTFLEFESEGGKIYKEACGASGEILFFERDESTSPRYVASKNPKIKKGLNHSETAHRFLNEIKLQFQAILHPNIHWPYKLGVINGTPYAFFRAWDGDLADYIYINEIDIPLKISLIIEIITGLIHCNELSLIHQDLKPDNIFIQKREMAASNLPSDYPLYRPLIADFGSVNLALTHRIFRGTRPYMAPEQWEESTLTEKTNVFAIGIMLHELVYFGAHPIGGSSKNWRDRVNPKYNRWQKNRIWKNWVKNGCPIDIPNDSHKDLDDVIKDFLALTPSARPSLEEAKKKLLSILKKRNNNMYNNLICIIGEAKRNTPAPNDWTHFRKNLEDFEKKINLEHPRAAYSAPHTPHT